MRYFSVFILVLFSSLTIILSFIFNFDISNGGSSADINTHWNYLKLLNQNLNNLITLKAGIDYKLLHFPLHHIIFSRFDFLMLSLNNYINFFFFFSLLLPIIFFLFCKKLFKELSIEKIIILTFLILLFPNFQSSAIWGNSHITALIFFLVSIYNLNLSKTYNNDLPRLNVFMSILFMTLATYTRQYYIIFFLYIIVKIYNYNKFKYIFFVLITLIFFSIPGIYYLIINPNLFFGLVKETTDFKSSVVIVLSIISFYLIPFFLIELRNNILSFNKIFSKKIIILMSLCSILLLYFCLNFSYLGTIGGGIFYKASLFLLNSNLILYLTSFLGLFLLFFYNNNKLDYIVLIIIIIFSFSSGIYIFQKYFEPLIFIIFLFLFDREKISNLLKNNINFLIYYFIFYWIIYFTYSSGYINIA